MITPAPLIAATGLRFRQRFHHDPDGTIRTVLHDGKAVRLTASQYEDVVAHFSKHSAPHHQMLRRRFNASIPIILLTLAITFGTHLSREIDKLAVPGAAVAAPLILLTWWPLLALFLHWRGIRALEAAIDVGLGSLPTAPSPPRRSHATQALQIVALFVIGPGLLIDIVGSLLPHAFDNTR
jgi:predicted secreted protein